MNLALSLASAVLLILIFPGFNLTWLAPVAIAPLLVACAREPSWKRRFLNGWAAGFVFWSGMCYWIQFVLAVHGGLGRWLAWVSFFVFGILKGLHLALFAALVGRLMPRWFAIPAVAALWTGIERTRMVRWASPGCISGTPGSTCPRWRAAWRALHRRLRFVVCFCDAGARSLWWLFAGRDVKCCGYYCFCR